VVKQMSELLTLEGDQMDVLNAVVDVMGKQWTNIMADKDKLCKAIGKKEFGELKCLRVDYFDLLLQTKKVLVGSIEQSKIQRENLANLLEILGNVTDTGFSSEGILDFDEGMATLQKWMDPTKLQRVMEKWSDLNKRLEAKKSKMQQLVEKLKVKDKWMKISIVAAAGPLLALSMAVGAGPVLAIYMAHVGMGGDSYLGLKKLQKSKNILQDILVQISEMKEKICDMQEEEEKIEMRYMLVKADNEKVEAMKRNLKAIDQYLINYQQKGDAAVLAVIEAYNAFIEK